MQSEMNAFTLNDNEFYRIKVTELGNDGFSSAIFKSPQELINHIEKYEKTISDRIQFYRHITIERVTGIKHENDLDEKRARQKLEKKNRVTKRKVDRKGRSI
jgi:hypothetical protein